MLWRNFQLTYIARNSYAIDNKFNYFLSLFCPHHHTHGENFNVNYTWKINTLCHNFLILMSSFSPIKIKNTATFIIHTRPLSFMCLCLCVKKTSKLPFWRRSIAKIYTYISVMPCNVLYVRREENIIMCYKINHKFQLKLSHHHTTNDKNTSNTFFSSSHHR